MLKKVLVLFVSCLLIFSMSFIYGAEKSNSNEEIELYRVEPCPLNCGGGLFTKTTYDEWYDSGESKPCSHYPFGLDDVYKRAVTTTTTCNNCNYGYSNSTVQTKLVCFGHN